MQETPRLCPECGEGAAGEEPVCAGCARSAWQAAAQAWNLAAAAWETARVEDESARAAWQAALAAWREAQAACGPRLCLCSGCWRRLAWSHSLVRDTS